MLLQYGTIMHLKKPGPTETTIKPLNMNLFSPSTFVFGLQRHAVTETFLLLFKTHRNSNLLQDLQMLEMVYLTFCTA